MPRESTHRPSAPLVSPRSNTVTPVKDADAVRPPLFPYSCLPEGEVTLWGQGEEKQVALRARLGRPERFAFEYQRKWRHCDPSAQVLWGLV